MDFHEYIIKAEAAINAELSALELATKQAKEVEVANLAKKAELKEKEAKLKAHEKEVDAKLVKLSRLEAIEVDQQKQIEREQAIEERERQAKKIMDHAADLQLQAEQALQSAKDVKDAANKHKAEVEAKILERFQKMVIGE